MSLQTDLEPYRALIELVHNDAYIPQARSNDAIAIAQILNSHGHRYILSGCQSCIINMFNDAYNLLGKPVFMTFPKQQPQQEIKKRGRKPKA